MEELSNAALLVQQPTENMPQCSQILDKEQENFIANPEPLIILPGHQSSSSAQQISPKPFTSSKAIPVLTNQTENSMTSTTLPLFSPEVIRPLPKVPPIKLKYRGRKTRKSTI